MPASSEPPNVGSLADGLTFGIWSPRASIKADIASAPASTAALRVLGPFIAAAPVAPAGGTAPALATPTTTPSRREAGTPMS
jgi:hypothetical protein